MRHSKMKTKWKKVVTLPILIYWDLVPIEDRSKLTTNYKEYVRNTLSGKDFLKEVK